MGIVGNPTDARFIQDAFIRLQRDYPWDYAYEEDDLLPEGWSFLGSGMYRAAFRSPDGVCYKVEKNPGSGYGQTNEEEFDNYLNLVRSVTMPEGTRLPAYTFYETGMREGYDGQMHKLGVSAMECIEGKTLSDMEDEGEEGPDDWAIIGKLNRACRLSDIHRGNVMYDGTDYVLVDIGA